MTDPGSPPGGSPGRDGVHLRLLWPQWQGAGTSSVRELASEFPLDVARRGGMPWARLSWKRSCRRTTAPP
jgi:arginase